MFKPFTYAFLVGVTIAGFRFRIGWLGLRIGLTRLFSWLGIGILGLGNVITSSESSGRETVGSSQSGNDQARSENNLQCKIYKSLNRIYFHCFRECLHVDPLTLANIVRGTDASGPVPLRYIVALRVSGNKPRPLSLKTNYFPLE